ncbi:hypothetical protein KZZ52_35180 [Dactylosporangium sp. AC04546]|uniref:hypothetical protein n=1 Tax=Dactylosporangium sp. AC04546 TaxID=2862460 RepID=UPI001EE14199|nr:hypothetical protein [Dactylosporangium sp. AC04546]WVK79215.1 hypothetical protein KZZ52_35180 [Dactylosporangium sp. AC04546]
MQDLPGYWDPLPHVDAVFAELPERDLRPTPEHVFCGMWEERNWRNVPGPFYGAMTDNCWVGRDSAPRHILYGDDIEYESEFLYRQPKNGAELRDVLAGMRDDPWSGWARDGDTYWTPALVRAWWHDRARLREWIERKHREWTSGGHSDNAPEAAAGLNDYLHYIDTGLAHDLRCYIAFLETGHAPAAGEPLPAL